MDDIMAPRWFDKEETLNAYDARIKYMQKMIELWKWESTAKALVYLNILGKMKISVLNDLLGLKGKSVFRSIKPLIENNFVEKVLDPQNLRDPYYQATGVDVEDPLFSKGFLEYLHQQQQQDILSNYLISANRGSITLISVMSEFMEKQLQRSATEGLDMLQNASFLEFLGEINDMSRVRNKFLELRKVLLEEAKATDPSSAKQSPVALYLAFLPLKVPK